MGRTTVVAVNLLADLDDEPMEESREMPKELPREESRVEHSSKRRKTLAHRDAKASKPSAGEPSLSKGLPPNGKEHASAVPSVGKEPVLAENIPKGPKPFRPSFHSQLHKRELTEKDAVSSDPSVAYALLKGICHPGDVAKLPKDKKSLGFSLMAKVAQAGQAAALFCDAVAASDLARKKEQEQAKNDLNSLKAKVVSLEEEKKNTELLAIANLQRAEVADRRAEAAERASGRC